MRLMAAFAAAASILAHSAFAQTGGGGQSGTGAGFPGTGTSALPGTRDVGTTGSVWEQDSTTGSLGANALAGRDDGFTTGALPNPGQPDEGTRGEKRRTPLDTETTTTR